MMMSPMTGEQVHSPKIGSKKGVYFLFPRLVLIFLAGIKEFSALVAPVN
jgi:hypothetical protein